MPSFWRTLSRTGISPAVFRWLKAFHLKRNWSLPRARTEPPNSQMSSARPRSPPPGLRPGRALSLRVHDLCSLHRRPSISNRIPLPCHGLPPTLVSRALGRPWQPRRQIMDLIPTFTLFAPRRPCQHPQRQWNETSTVSASTASTSRASLATS